MSIEMKAKCDRCGREVRTEDRLPMGWADVRFRLQYPTNMPDADRRMTYHACDVCVLGLWNFMLRKSLLTPQDALQGESAEGERR